MYSMQSCTCCLNEISLLPEICQMQVIPSVPPWWGGVRAAHA